MNVLENTFNSFNTAYIFKGELGRGLLCSMASGTISNGINTLSIKLGLLPLTSSLIWLFIFGHIFTYCLDILYFSTGFEVFLNDLILFLSESL